MRRILVVLLVVAGSAAAQFTATTPLLPPDPATPPGPFAVGPAAPPADLPPVQVPAPPALKPPPAVAFPPPADAKGSGSRPGDSQPGSPKPADAKADGPKFEPFWNNGLFVRSGDKNFLAHVGGTIQYDGGWYSGGSGLQALPGGIGRLNDGVTPRRLRIMLDGSMWGTVDYKFDIEFANGFYPPGLSQPASVSTVFFAPTPTDAWVTLRDVPWVGNVRVGNQKEWFSLEHLESQRYLLFMERSYLFDASQPSAFNNARSPGVSVFRTWANDSIFTAAGVYKNTSDTFGYGVNDGEYAATGRVAVLPVWLPQMQTYWHVGGAMTLRDPVNDGVRVRVRESVRSGPNPFLNLIADTSTIPADHQSLYNLETAFSSGPLTVSGEYTANVVNLHGRGGSAVFDGFYSQAMWFLTGEHRDWDPKIGAFKRVIPFNNLDPKAGTWGAFETGARVQHLNLDNNGVTGGRLTGVTLGLNWYWNPNVKVQVNYDYLYRDGGATPAVKGSVHAVGTRLAMDF